MLLKEIRELSHGDEVYWTDPDDGLCNKHITIREIQINEDPDDPALEEDEPDAVIIIHGINGEYLECFAQEL